MGQQMAQSDGPTGGSDDRLSIATKALQYTYPAKIGDDVRGRFVELQLTPFHKLHGGRGGNGLGHGSDGEYGIHGHGHATAQGSFTEGALVKSFLAADNYCHDPRHVAPVHSRRQQIIQASVKHLPHPPCIGPNG